MGDGRVARLPPPRPGCSTRFARRSGEGYGWPLCCLPRCWSAYRVTGKSPREFPAIRRGFSRIFKRVRPIWLQNSDCGKLVSLSNSGPVAVTLPQAGTVMATGCWFELQNTGAGTVTITPVGSTIDGTGSLTLPTGAGLQMVSCGGNYDTEPGSASAGGRSGAVGAASSGQLAYYPAPGSAITGCSVGGAANGDLSCNSISSNGTFQGQVDLYPAANSATYVGLAAPEAVPSTYVIQLPGAVPASGQVLSFGAPANGTSVASWANAIVLAGVGPLSAIPSSYLFPNEFYLTTDSSDCINGGGSTSVLCMASGPSWVPVGGGQAPRTAAAEEVPRAVLRQEAQAR